MAGTKTKLRSSETIGANLAAPRDRVTPPSITGTARTPKATLPKRHRASDPDDFKSSMLNIRIRDDLKREATRTLERIGISLPEAVRVFLGRIVREQAFPFPLEVPNAETAAALRESMATDHERHTALETMFDDLEKEGVR